jgi:ubiquinone/menaquinone biosynthesis C-methylase UbiE
VHVDTVLHHVVGPSRSASKDAVRDVLAEVERVLKPDGYVLIIERFQIARGIPDRALSQLIFWGLKFASPVVALSGSNPKVGQPPICFYTEDELLELTRNAGFALEDLARVREHEFLPLRRIIQKESQRVTLFLRNE